MLHFDLTGYEHWGFYIPGVAVKGALLLDERTPFNDGTFLGTKMSV